MVSKEQRFSPTGWFRRLLPQWLGKQKDPWGDLPENRFGTPPAKAVLVHQPGKVGSSSIYIAMRASLPVPAYQTHAMNTELEQFNRKNLLIPEGSSDELIHIQKARKFLRLFYFQGYPFGVLTLVRDPVARNVSAFFQNIADYEHLCDFGKPQPVGEYIDTFLETHDHEFADRWFDYHFKQPFGVDCYEEPFDPEVGCHSFTDGNNTFLIMQSELADSQKEVAIRDWLNFDGFSMSNRANVGEQKAYAEVYRTFKSMPLPPGYLDRMYSSRVARHFYSADQLAGFRRKWE